MAIQIWKCANEFINHAAAPNDRQADVYKQLSSQQLSI